MTDFPFDKKIERCVIEHEVKICNNAKDITRNETSINKIFVAIKEQGDIFNKKLDDIKKGQFAFVLTTSGTIILSLLAIIIAFIKK